MGKRMRLLLGLVNRSVIKKNDAIGNEYEVRFDAGWIELSITPDTTCLWINSDDLREMADIADVVYRDWEAMMAKVME